MYAVTYQAEELNLFPTTKHAQIHFNGDLDLDAKPDGSWTIDTIWVDIATPGPKFSIKHTLTRLAGDHPLYALIVAAAEAHDKATQAISDHVREELDGADRAAYADARYQLGKDIARGLEVR
ncbi:hypothetical protein [Bosea sp. AS-1]|uniref:hypothetical protein n=1 Tax=Bosea sp. AS-1 TaxID=2015316 RepID=UPI000B790DDE|nr:hypothetical protein [Bosea sp. AS-1]